MAVCASPKPVESEQSFWQAPDSNEVAKQYWLLSERQSAQTAEQLCELQSRLMGPVGLFSRLARQVAEQGRQAPLLADLGPLKNDHGRQAMAEQAVQFALGLHWRREATSNPYAGLQREYLCCVVFDELAPFTLVERYAASAALRQLDSEYFGKLIATTRNTVERRIVFIGLLEHFDALLPVERSIYPLNYRAAQQSHLENEERTYGKLELDAPVRELLERYSPHWLLTHLCQTGLTSE
jgi:hypothetical protein